MSEVKSCPKCNVGMDHRLGMYECPGCGHAENKSIPSPEDLASGPGFRKEPSHRQEAQAGRESNVEIDERFCHPSYRFRQRFWSLWGQRIDVFSSLGTPVLHCYQKALRLKEDIRLYGDPQHTEELLHIQARQIIDFSAAYDVWDVKAGSLAGTLRRAGWTSLARDRWEILTPQQEKIATIEEDAMGLALLRRFALGMLLPATWYIQALGAQNAATVRTQFNLIFTVLLLNVHSDSFSEQLVDPRLLIAATTLLALIEGKQQSYG